MPLDREDTLRKAEKLVRQGRLDAAIAEYARLVEEFPNDWNSANLLGDLYARVGQADRAAALWTRVAASFFAQGFVPRAVALYKKILKIKPDDESAQLQLGEVSARQGLLVEAKAHLNAVAERRAARGDRHGANEIRLRLASIDPADVDARRSAARILAEAGDPEAGAAQLKETATDLFQRGKDRDAIEVLREALRLVPGDVRTRAHLVRAALAAGEQATALEYLTPDAAGQDPALGLLFLDAQARAGHIEEARATVVELLVAGRRDDVVELAWRLGGTAGDGAFVCIETIVDKMALEQQWADAVGLLQQFVARLPNHVPALLKLIEVCVDSGLELAMYAAQAQLADAYLATGRASEARALAEDLVAHEPWDESHLGRFRQALVLLGEPDPDSVIAQRLSGDMPFAATDRFSTAEPQAPIPVEPPSPPPGPIEEEARAEVYNLKQPDEIDLTDALGELTVSRDVPSALLKEPLMPAGGDDARDDNRNLDEVFREFREEVSRDTSAESAAEHLALARAYSDVGMPDQAIEALQVAARSPRHRFEAASLLGRLWRERGDVARTIEWLERAAEAPAPSVDEGRALLYELGDVLEQSGETMRALAVFLELEADAGDYRDVRKRTERLSRVQAE